METSLPPLNSDKILKVDNGFVGTVVFHKEMVLGGLILGLNVLLVASTVLQHIYFFFLVAADTGDFESVEKDVEYIVEQKLLRDAVCMEE